MMRLIDLFHENREYIIVVQTEFLSSTNAWENPGSEEMEQSVH